MNPGKEVLPAAHGKLHHHISTDHSHIVDLHYIVLSFVIKINIYNKLFYNKLFNLNQGGHLLDYNKDF